MTPTPSSDRSYRRLLGTLVFVGLALRVGLALSSYGSRDALYWSAFARDANARGYFELWRARADVNHPPLPVAYAAVAWKLVGDDARYQWRFCLLLKAPGIAADLATAALLARIGRRRATLRAGATLGGIYLLSPLAVLISGYHGNTDPVLAFGCLAAFDAMDRGRPGLAGMALAAAINVKLAPLVLVAPALALCGSPRAAARFLVALAAGALPFVPLLAAAGEAFFWNAIGYELFEARWGLMYPALLAEGHDRRDIPRAGLVAAYVTIGKVMVWLWTLAAAAWQWRRQRLDAFELGALAFALLLVFAPGFGVQYLLWPLPLMVAARPRFAAAYGAIAGAFAAAAYVAFLVPGRWPLVSNLNDLMPHGVALVGVAAWMMLAWFAIRLLTRGPRPVHSPNAALATDD